MSKRLGATRFQSAFFVLVRGVAETAKQFGAALFNVHFLGLRRFEGALPS